MELDSHKLYGGPAPEGVEMLSARKSALLLLEGVLGQKQTLDSLLEKEQHYKSLPSQDKAFCRMLVATALRRLGQIDDLIYAYEDKPGSVSKNLTLQNILRLGVTQIFFMHVADHAAVDTAVRLTEAAGLEKQKGFVNGVLRALLRKGQERFSKQDAARMNTPEWLLKRWIDDYGLNVAAQIATAHLAEAPLDITVKDKDSVNYWGATLQASSFPTGSLRRTIGGNVTQLSGFDDGMWWVQDASAAIPAKLFGDIEGRTVVDMCAAPGGKTAQLASMGANVTAVDRSAQRIKKLHQNLERLRLKDGVESVVADATSWKPKAPASHILLDAPCSATGTARRHPDVLRLKSQIDIDRLISVQARLLDHAFDQLAPGGILIYCTCSLEKAEGETQISNFLERQPAARKIAITPEDVGDLDELITEEGDVRILPYMQAASGGMDGFFISRLKKV